MNRVTQFVNLPLHVLDSIAIQREMRAIGERAPEQADGQH
jgi:arsenate reductase